LKRVDLLARDTGAPAAFAFAARHPERLGRVVMLNPHPPTHQTGELSTFRGSVQARLLRNPDLVGAFAQFLRRQATTPLIARILARSFGDIAVDAGAMADPDVVTFLTRDIQAMCARSGAGFAAEHGLYARGWTPAASPAARGWTFAVSTVAPSVDLDWAPVPDMTVVKLEGAGVLPQFTHAEALADLVA
jgi:pimeloyl-ACP methyl ester carboxylesterase